MDQFIKQQMEDSNGRRIPMVLAMICYIGIYWVLQGDAPLVLSWFITPSSYRGTTFSIIFPYTMVG